jgi:hypothetical protein
MAFTFHLPFSQAFLKNSDCGQTMHLCTLASNAPHVMVRSEYALLSLRLEAVSESDLHRWGKLVDSAVTYLNSNSLYALP